MKTCPRCNEPKPPDQFWSDRFTKSGIAVYCIPCGTMRNAEKYRAKAAEEQPGVYAVDVASCSGTTTVTGPQ